MHVQPGLKSPPLVPSLFPYKNTVIVEVKLDSQNFKLVLRTVVPLLDQSLSQHMKRH